ncbi:hypothetical protein [Schlesneria sp. DSM 10557]|uniref:hypothetical protein n=1 Tax=Schlesneria sp. DSM 10557 TaxID=3044399 RepID=UPI0035A13695
MLKFLWSRTIVGNIAFVTEDSVVTCPDGKGGVWARYRRDDGALIWWRWHYRGGQFQFVTDEVIISSFFASAGIYATDFRTGKRLWSRLGYTFNLLLKLCDLLPVNNEGDFPLCEYQGCVLTQDGALLDPRTGRVNRRCKIEIGDHVPSENGVDTLLKTNSDLQARIDGQPWRIRQCCGFQYYGTLTAELIFDASILKHTELRLNRIQATLQERRMTIAGFADDWSVRLIKGMLIFVARDLHPDPTHQHDCGDMEHGCLNVRHRLMVLRDCDLSLEYSEELGNYAYGRPIWSNGGLVGISLMTRNQYRYSLRGANLLRVYAFNT